MDLAKDHAYFVFVKQGGAQAIDAVSDPDNVKKISPVAESFETFNSTDVVTFRVDNSKIKEAGTAPNTYHTIAYNAAEALASKFEEGRNYDTYLVVHSAKDNKVFQSQTHRTLQIPKWVLAVTPPTTCQWNDDETELQFTVLRGTTTPAANFADQVHFVFVKQGSGQAIEQICDPGNLGKFAQVAESFATFNGTDVVTFRAASANSSTFAYHAAQPAVAKADIFEAGKKYTVYLAVYDPAEKIWHYNNTTTGTVAIPQKITLTTDQVRLLYLRHWDGDGVGDPGFSCKDPETNKLTLTKKLSSQQKKIQWNNYYMAVQQLPLISEKKYKQVT